MLTPSPELAARIQQWIDELPTEGLQYWLQRVCQELGALPLHGTMIYLWAVRPDGMVLRIDHEAFGHPVEPETDPLTVYAVILQGAQDYPELRDLRPLRPTGVHECDLCGGVGWVESAPDMGGSATCARCNGLGQTISS